MLVTEMNKTLLIFKHEFFQIIKRKGFIVMTLIVPLLALLFIGFFNIISDVINSKDTQIESIGYVNETTGFDKYMSQGEIQFVRYGSAKSATEALLDEKINEYFIIPSDYMSTGVIMRYTLKMQFASPNASTSAIEKFLLSNLIDGKLPQGTTERVKAPLILLTNTLTADGKLDPAQAKLGNFIIMSVFALLFALTMMFSSTYMLQSLGEEKESRILEILLSSVSSRQLLTGKVLGIGTTGLVQALVWALSVPFLIKLASSTIGLDPNIIELPIGYLIIGIIYFILGYLLFAVFSASIGAISRNTQEGQQLATIYTLFTFAPMWLISLVIAFPDSLVWIVFSIFPFSAPTLMMIRLGVGNIEIWELIVSILVLLSSIIFYLLLSAKVFTVYLLMYGKRPRLNEILRAIKSK